MALATLALPVKVTELKVLARPVSCGSGDILALGCFSETSEHVVMRWMDKKSLEHKFRDDSFKAFTL